MSKRSKSNPCLRGILYQGVPFNYKNQHISFINNNTEDTYSNNTVKSYDFLMVQDYDLTFSAEFQNQ